MLVLTRKLNEAIVIDGHIVVKIVRIEGNYVKLGIVAPAEMQVNRQEILEAFAVVKKKEEVEKKAKESQSNLPSTQNTI